MKTTLNILFIAALLVSMTSGCAAGRSASGSSEARPASRDDAENSITSNRVKHIVVPESGFSWEKLASIAAARGSDAQLTALHTKRSNLQNRLERAWRNPQLRLNSSFASEDEYESRGDNEHEDIDEYGASLRFYISNPFVNRWIKKQATTSAKAILAERRELSYAIYCETRMKCCEAAIIEDKLNQLEATLTLRKQICGRYKELRASGHAAPLKIIKAALKRAEIEQEIEIKTREYRNALFQIALLTGLETEKIKLESINKQALPEPATYSTDDLTISAIRTRPDLESLRCEEALARAELNAAKARQIPWFEFVEGGYRNRSADAKTYSGASPDRSDSDRDEWLVRTGISLPIFSWSGQETALAETTLSEVKLRESIALTAIRDEIKNALENYAEVCGARQRVSEKTSGQLKEFQKAVNALDHSQTVIETEIMEIQEQLIAFRRGTRRSLYECLKLKLYLESVSGLRSCSSIKFTEPRTHTDTH